MSLACNVLQYPPQEKFYSYFRNGSIAFSTCKADKKWQIPLIHSHCAEGEGRKKGSRGESEMTGEGWLCSCPCPFYPFWQAQSCNPLPVAQVWSKHSTHTDAGGWMTCRFRLQQTWGLCTSATHGQKSFMSKPPYLEVSHCAKCVRLPLGQGTVVRVARGSFWWLTAVRLMMGLKAVGMKELRPVSHVRSCINMFNGMHSHFLSQLCELKDISFLLSKNELHRFPEKHSPSLAWLWQIFLHPFQWILFSSVTT